MPAFSVTSSKRIEGGFSSSDASSLKLASSNRKNPNRNTVKNCLSSLAMRAEILKFSNGDRRSEGSSVTFRFLLREFPAATGRSPREQWPAYNRGKMSVQYDPRGYPLRPLEYGPKR